MCSDHDLRDPGQCDRYVRSLREARCISSDANLLDSLKRFQCGSYGSSNIVMPSISTVMMMLIMLLSSHMLR